MKPKQGKYLLAIGIALVVLGLSLLPFDAFVAIISILFGLSTGIKGYGISKGRQPYLVRKQQKRDEKEREEQKNTHPLDHMKHKKK